ncbi:MAG: hypothetical protein ACK4VJ_02665 [Rhodoluna sp.]
MPRKIRLGSLFPEDLNLNGDQANLLVLKKRLELRGVSSLVVDIPLNKIDDVDFLFLGHGSIAAWEFISRSEPRLFAQLSSFVESGKPLFAVSSGALKVLSELGKNYEEGDHVSEFATAQDDIVGYLNSPSKAPLIQKLYSSWFTMLHGPILAKNPDLADKICFELGWFKKVPRSPEASRLDELSSISRKTAFEH